METAYHYKVNINWKNDRLGLMSSPELQLAIQVATPPEFTKGIAGIWSPEHLLVAAVNSCLMTTFLTVAENSKLNFIHFESNADGKLEKVAGKYMISEVVLTPLLTIQKEADRERAIRILEKAAAACLVSNSLKSTIIFKPQVKLQKQSFINSIN